MPYFFKCMLKTPLDQEHLWDRFREIWKIVDADISFVRFEDNQDALNRTNDSRDPDDFSDLAEALILYRESDDRLNLKIFHLMGLKALEKTDVAIRKQELSPQFLNQWTILMQCHGAIVPSLMALRDDLPLGQRGNEEKRIDAERKKRWLAHLLYPHLDDGRKSAEGIVTTEIRTTIDKNILPAGVDVDWYASFLTEAPDRWLKSAYRQNNFSNARVEELAKQSADDLPPLPLITSTRL